MLLQILFLQQKIANVGAVATHHGVAEFSPGKQRWIVKNMNAYRYFLPDLMTGPVRRILRNKVWQFLLAVQDFIKIVQSFNAGETVLRVLAEQRHETGIPDPDLAIAKRFIHIRILRHTRQVKQMVMRQFPRLPIQLIVLGDVLRIPAPESVISIPPPWQTIYRSSFLHG